MVVKKQNVSLQRHDKDTGSPEFQISLLSTEITELQAHLVLHKKDFDAKRSLLKKVADLWSILKKQILRLMLL